MKPIIWILLSGLLLFGRCLEINTSENTGNSLTPNDSLYTAERTYFRILFYNVENLFDPLDDPHKNDNEFLPDQNRYWTWKKFNEKINHTYKVFVAAGGWDPPELIGLCEIENLFVLRELVQSTPFAKHNYRIIHKESPDQRGIDVALLYDPEEFHLIKTGFIEVTNPENKSFKTRDILYAKGITNNDDTLHCYVNHWPSRWGGQRESEPKRILAAGHLREHIDSIFYQQPYAKIVVMGDFNDEPQNKSLQETLKAHTNISSPKPAKLYNLSTELEGTLKYQGSWQVFDQFIVSGNVLKDQNGTSYELNNAHVFKPDFLLVEDETHYGYKPYRTFSGYKYIGGFSDHLPIYLDLCK